MQKLDESECNVNGVRRIELNGFIEPSYDTRYADMHMILGSLMQAVVFEAAFEATSSCTQFMFLVLLFSGTVILQSDLSLLVLFSFCFLYCGRFLLDGAIVWLFVI